MFYFANEAYSGILIRDGDGAYLGISLTYSFNTRVSQVTLREMGNATYQTKLIYKTYREGIVLHCTTLWYERLLLRLVNTILRFLAATKQLYGWFSPSVCMSVCLSVCLSHLFDYVPITVSSWNFQELLPMTEVTSVQKVKVRCQRSRSQRSTPHLAVSGL